MFAGFVPADRSSKIGEFRQAAPFLIAHGSANRLGKSLDGHSLRQAFAAQASAYAFRIG